MERMKQTEGKRERQKQRPREAGGENAAERSQGRENNERNRPRKKDRERIGNGGWGMQIYPGARFGQGCDLAAPRTNAGARLRTVGRQSSRYRQVFLNGKRL